MFSPITASSFRVPILVHVASSTRSGFVRRRLPSTFNLPLRPPQPTASPELYSGPLERAIEALQLGKGEPNVAFLLLAKPLANLVIDDESQIAIIQSRPASALKKRCFAFNENNNN